MKFATTYLLGLSLSLVASAQSTSTTASSLSSSVATTSSNSTQSGSTTSGSGTVSTASSPEITVITGLTSLTPSQSAAETMIPGGAAPLHAQGAWVLALSAIAGLVGAGVVAY